MARDFARLRHSIWSDDTFLALKEAEQRAYMLVLSQPSMSYCGVLPYTLRRWAGLAADSSLPKLKKSLAVLEEERFIVTDEDSEELMVRSFVKHDGILASPNVCRATVKAFPKIHSPRLKAVFLSGLHALRADVQEEGWDKGWAVLSELLLITFEEPLENLPQGLPQAFGESRAGDVLVPKTSTQTQTRGSASDVLAAIPQQPSGLDLVS